MYREPEGPGIRVDAGVVEGGEVSVYYDPMLAKLIVAAETRTAAIARAVAALRRYVVLGIRTNIPYLLAVLRHPRFLSGDLDTGFLASERDALLAMLAHPDVPVSALAAAAYHSQQLHTRQVKPTSTTDASSDPFTTIGGWGLS
jgi:acetyl/propionyl-CoA carboxylase alpha subunit